MTWDSSCDFLALEIGSSLRSVVSTYFKFGEAVIGTADCLCVVLYVAIRRLNSSSVSQINAKVIHTQTPTATAGVNSEISNNPSTISRAKRSDIA
jgi:hypothetical protein